MGGLFFDFESLEDVGAVAARQRERGHVDGVFMKPRRVDAVVMIARESTRHGIHQRRRRGRGRPRAHADGRLLRAAEGEVPEAAQARAYYFYDGGEDPSLTRSRHSTTSDDRAPLGEDGVYEPKEVGLERRRHFC